MSLPGATLASGYHPATFNYRRNRRDRPLEDYEMGGIALSDPSRGSLYQLWRATADGDDVVATDAAGKRYVLFSRAGISELALAFDQNMHPFVAFVEASVPRFWWYDTVAAAQVFSDLPGDAKNPRATLDDKRAASSGASDIVLAYLRGADLYYRLQRDRYATEYLLTKNAGARLDTVNITENFRLQFALSRS